MRLLDLPQPIREHAVALAASLDPLTIKRSPLNRDDRRRLMALSRKGQLRAEHLPIWLVMMSFINVRA